MTRLLGFFALALIAVWAGWAVPSQAAGWGPLSWGMSESDAQAALGGNKVEKLKRSIRLGNYKAEFRGPAYLVADIQMRPLPLFGVESRKLEMVILTKQEATPRDFVELYQSLVKRYGKELASNSERQGKYRIFDSRWKEGPTSIGLYFDQSGQLLTLEYARTPAAGPEPYGDKPWIRTDEWANICGCDVPIYYFRCSTPGYSKEPSQAALVTPLLP